MVDTERLTNIEFCKTNCKYSHYFRYFKIDCYQLSLHRLMMNYNLLDQESKLKKSDEYSILSKI